MDLSSLNRQQRHAIAQLRELTGDSSDDAAANILESVDWDVQRATELIFGGSSSTGPPVPPPSMQQFDIDDSEQGTPGSPDSSGWQNYSSVPSLIISPLKSVFSVLAYPLHFLNTLLRFLFGVLRIPFPQFQFGGTVSYRLLRSTPRRTDTPDSWVRELEEETGAVCISTLSSREAQVSGINARPSTSTATHRSVASGSGESTKVLPDFVLSSYESFLRRCVDEIVIGCVVLVSEEHDDVPEFKRSTLTNPAFVNMLCSNNILVWGGDVRSKEAWSASEKLQATTYPFVAFVALQSKRSLPSSSSRTPTSTTPVLTVISRHQGRSVPSTAPTSASTLIEQVERFLPRINPTLERLRLVKRDRERDRVLREEQDRAFRETKDRDRDRINAKIAAEREKKRAQELLAQQVKEAQEQRMKAAEEQSIRIMKRVQRRRWTRRSTKLVESDSKDTIRIAFSFPRTGRVIHRFHADATLTELYKFVDIHLIPADLLPSEDPSSPSDEFPSDDLSLQSQIQSASSSEEWWGYRLLLAYPRREILWQPCTKIVDVDYLKGGGHVVVEVCSEQPLNGMEDGGYISEE